MACATSASGISPSRRPTVASLYLIQRGPRPDYHRAPFHPVVIADLKRVAKWEAGWSGDCATVWEREGWCYTGAGWLLARWQGMDVDYGHLVRVCSLPGGGRAGFWRDYPAEQSVEGLFPGAVWYSIRKMPKWLEERGVVYPSDQFTRQHILDLVADDGLHGFCHIRNVPEWWTELKEAERG